MIIAVRFGEGRSVFTTPGRFRLLLKVRSAAAFTTALVATFIVASVVLAVVTMNMIVTMPVTITVIVLVTADIPTISAVRRRDPLDAIGVIGRGPLTLADPAELFHRAALAVGTQLQHQRDRQEQACSEHHPYKECAFDWVAVK